MRIWLTWLSLALLGMCNGRVVKVLRKISDDASHPYPPSEDIESVDPLHDSGHIPLNHQSNEDNNNHAIENDRFEQPQFLLFPPEVFKPEDKPQSGEFNSSPESENIPPSTIDKKFNLTNLETSPSAPNNFGNGQGDVPSFSSELPPDFDLSPSSVPAHSPTLPSEEEFQTAKPQEVSELPAIPIPPLPPLPSTEYGPPPLLPIVECCPPPGPTSAPYPPPPPTLPPDDDSQPIAYPSFNPGLFPQNPPPESVASAASPYPPLPPTLPPNEDSGPILISHPHPHSIPPIAEYGPPPPSQLPEEGSLSLGIPTEKGPSVIITHILPLPPLVKLPPPPVSVETLPSTVLTKEYVPSLPISPFQPFLKLLFTPHNQLLPNRFPVYPTLQRLGPNKLPSALRLPTQLTVDIVPSVPFPQLPELHDEYGLPSYEYGAPPAVQTQNFKQDSSS